MIGVKMGLISLVDILSRARMALVYEIQDARIHSRTIMKEADSVMV
jgi:hypothetical protein